MIKVALLDDYQNVALQKADWASLADAQVDAFSDHLAEEDAVAARLADYDVVMALRERTPFPASLLERLPRLKLLASAGKRNAAIDLEACTRLGIVVMGTEGSARSTMELTWGLILCALRHIPEEQQATRAGRWQLTLGRSLQGLTLGLIGLGSIGAQTAEVGRAFRMNLIAWSQNLTAERAAECGAAKVPLDELLRQADLVTIHTRLSDRTRGLLGARELGLMKPDAWLVNTSRGPIVEEAALLDVLRRRAIGGAALDTFDVEPLPAGHPFLAMDNVVLTPHLGYVTEGGYDGYYQQTLENIRTWRAGSRQERRLMNPEVWEKRRAL